MTNYEATLDAACRRYMNDQRREALEHPGRFFLGQMLGHVLCIFLARRILRKLGLPVTRLQSWALVSIFGRGPGYPHNLVWQVRRGTATRNNLAFDPDEFSKLLMAALRKRVVDGSRPPAGHAPPGP